MKLLIFVLLLNTGDAYDSLLAKVNEPETPHERLTALTELSHHIYRFSLDSFEVYSIEALLLAEELQDEESLGKLFLTMGRYHCELGEVDSAKMYLEKSLLVNQKLHNEMNVALTYFYLASTLSNMDDYETPITYHKEGISLFKKLGKDIWRMRSNVSLGWVYRESGNVTKATESYVEALKIADELDHDYGRFDCYHELGYVYLDNKQFEKAEETFTKVLEIAQKLKSQSRISIAYGDLSSLYYDQQDYAQSLKYNLKDLEIQQELGYAKDLPLIYNNIAGCYLHMGQFEQSIKYSQLSLKLEIAYRGKYDQTISKINLAAAYLETGKQQEAEQLSKEAVTDAFSIKNMDLMLSSLKQQFRVMRRLGYAEKALELSGQYHQLKDSAFNLEKAQLIDEISTKYETEKKEQLIRQLNVEKQSAELKRNSYFVGFILAAAIIIMLIFWMRNTRKKNLFIRKIEQLMAQERLAKVQYELKSYTDKLVEKNHHIESLNGELESLKREINSNCPNYSKNIDNLIQSTILTEEEWDQFKNRFLQVYPGFFLALREQHSGLTETEERLFALRKLKLSNKEISGMLGISSESVGKSKYRVRKKLNMTDEQIDALIAQI